MLSFKYHLTNYRRHVIPYQTRALPNALLREMHEVCGHAYCPAYDHALTPYCAGVPKVWLEVELSRAQCVVFSHSPVMLFTDAELGAWSHGQCAVLTRIIIESNTL